MRSTTDQPQSLMAAHGRRSAGPCAASYVWLIHPVPDLNINDAKRFGELRCVAPEGRYLFGDQVDDLAIPDFMRQELQACAEVFDPDNDFLLLAGDHAQLIILGAMLTARHGKFTMLRFDRLQRGYFPIKVQV